MYEKRFSYERYCREKVDGLVIDEDGNVFFEENGTPCHSIGLEYTDSEDNVFGVRPRTEEDFMVIADVIRRYMAVHGEGVFCSSPGKDFSFPMQIIFFFEEKDKYPELQKLYTFFRDFWGEGDTDIKEVRTLMDVTPEQWQDYKQRMQGRPNWSPGLYPSNVFGNRKGFKLNYGLGEQLELSPNENCVEIRAVNGDGLYAFSEQVIGDKVNELGLDGIQWVLVNENASHSCESPFEGQFKVLPVTIPVYEAEDYYKAKALLDRIKSLDHKEGSDKLHLFVFYGKGMRQESYALAQMGKGKNALFVIINETPKQYVYPRMPDVIMDVRLDPNSRKQSVTISRPLLTKH